MPKDFSTLWGWQNSSAFKIAESLRSLTMAGAFAASTENLRHLNMTGALATSLDTYRMLGLSRSIATENNQYLRSTMERLADSPMITASREWANSPIMKVARELAESPIMKVARELAESPVMKVAKALAESPAMKVAKELAENPAMKATKSLAVRGVATTDIFGGSSAHLTAFDSFVATPEILASATAVSQFESVLERVGGWSRVADSVARHFAPDYTPSDVWEKDEPELEGAVAHIKYELATGKSLEDIANQVSAVRTLPQEEGTDGVGKDVFISLIVAFLLWLANVVWESAQKTTASLPAILYAEQHEAQLAIVVNKTGVNVRETNDDNSFSVHRFDEGVYVLLMHGKTKNRREFAYQYDDNNDPIKTGWVPPSALRIVK